MLEIPDKLAFLFPDKYCEAAFPVNYTHPITGLPMRWVPSRWKALLGGRGGLKTWQIARALVCHAAERRLRILCARETLKSISESVHQELKTQIDLIGLSSAFEITDNSIRSRNGSEFLFRGLRIDPGSLKSLADIDVCWVEEGANVSKDSWRKLIPTIRKPSSEIWVSFNPELESDPVYVDHITNGDKRPAMQVPAHERSIVVTTNWQDNPWLSAEMIAQKDKDYAVDKDEADHVWGGQCIKHSAAAIFNGKVVMEDFTPGLDWHGPYFGLDFGYSNDPAVFGKAWVYGDRAYLEEEIYGKHIDLKDYPAWMTKVHGWWRQHRQAGKVALPNIKIKADSSAPAMIEFLRGNNIPAVACQKWPGCVEDRIAVLRAFDKIVIHPRCRPEPKNTKHGLWNEARLYRYKKDPKTEEISSTIVDAFNHSWDMLGYALEDFVIAGEQDVVVVHDSVQQGGISISPELDRVDTSVDERAAFGFTRW